MPKFDNAWIKRTENDAWNLWLIEALIEGAVLTPQDDYPKSHRWRLAFPDGTALSLHVSSLINLRERGYITFAYEPVVLAVNAAEKLQAFKEELSAASREDSNG